MEKRVEKLNWKANFKALKYIPRFFKLIWETNSSLFLVNIFLRLFKSFLPVILLYIGKLIIDEVVLQISLDEKQMTYLWQLLALELALAIFSDLFERAIGLSDGLLADLYSNKSSVELIQKAASMPLSQLEDSAFYDKLELARRQTNNRVTLMSTVLSQAQDLITVISLIAGLIYFEPWLILLLFIAIIPSFLNEIKYSRSSYSLVRSWAVERRELDYLRYIGASDVTAKEIKLFNLADFISNRFAHLADKYFLANKKLSIKRAFWGSIYHVIGDLSYYSAYFFIILRTVGGLLSLGDLTFLSYSFRRLRNELQRIFSRLSRITESALYLKDYFDFLDIRPDQEILYENVEGAEKKSLPKQEIISQIKEGFYFENVSFRYPEAKDYVLKDINFKLKVGEKLALVGENGAGKTTLVKLLLGMYKPTSGRILLDGIDIQRFHPTDYQKIFGVIFQDFVKYYFKAGENIAVGKIEDIENQAKIEFAAEQSLANEVVEGLPGKYDQVLGKRFKNGQELSGGQWQKIALARAYMKDAEVIVLDEPTAALDARAEFEAFKRFTSLTKGKTAVLISHRFSTLRMADRILVLKDGRNLELGTHQELLARKGLYAELFGLQAAGYR